MTRRPIAVTNHAVDRYQERVEGAKGFDRESVRNIIRDLVEQGFHEGVVRPHPREPDRRIIPFKSGKSVLFLSIGPNTSGFQHADMAVIGVLFEKEVTEGKVGVGVTLEEAFSFLSDLQVPKERAPKYTVFVGSGDVEMYRPKTEAELEQLLDRLGLSRGEVLVYKLES